MFKKKNNLPPFPVLDKIGTIDEYLEEYSNILVEGLESKNPKKIEKSLRRASELSVLLWF